VALGVSVLAALACLWALSARLAPLAAVVAEDEVNNRIQQIVNRAVDALVQEQGLSYEDVVALERNDQGAVLSASTDMGAVNLLRTALTARILEEIDGLDLRTLDIPLGSLSGLDLLSGWGPSLRVDALWVGTVQTELDNEFSAAGINQTLHRVMLQVTVPATVLLPTGRVETQVVTQVCVAENIIVGTVPETYIQMAP
jgi:sporulation protein YunB